MGTIASVKITMGYTLDPAPGATRCAACRRASWQPRRTVRGAGNGLWCAAGQYWTLSRAACRWAQP